MTASLLVVQWREGGNCRSHLDRLHGRSGVTYVASRSVCHSLPPCPACPALRCAAWAAAVCPSLDRVTGFDPAPPCAQGPRPAIIGNFLQDRTCKSLICQRIWRYDPLFRRLSDRELPELMG